jgi:transposase
MAARAWVVKTIGDKFSEPLRYCIESTGTYHMPVLRAFKGEPSVVNPLLAGPSRRKTDTLDARLLAHHSITGLWAKSFVPSEDGLQLRVMWASRGEGVRNATRSSNRVNNIILRFGHTIAAENPVRSAVGRALIGSLVEGEIPNVPHVSPEGLPGPMRPVIGALMADLDMHTARAKKAEKDAVDFVSERRWPTAEGTLPGDTLLKLLMTVPGVGQTTALAWLSEVVDPRRFKSSEQVAAFAGCDPSLKVSAGKVTDFVRRKGNDKLHRALLFAASSAMRQPDSRLGLWGQAIAGRHRKGGHRKATGAVARRIATGLWHVHRLGAEFGISHYHFGLPPQVCDAPVSSLGLSARHVALLPQGLLTAQDVVSAYWKGSLGGVPGLGERAFKKISDWMKAHPSRRGKNRVYILDKNKTYEPKS